MRPDHTTDTAAAAPPPASGTAAGTSVASAPAEPAGGWPPGDPEQLPARSDAFARALTTLSYEILPFNGTEEAVLAHVPRSIAMSVTTTEAKGLAPTLRLATRLAGHGYSATPHIAARQVRDRDHLVDIVDELTEGGVTGIFVIAGDAASPAGEFTDALSLLRRLDECGHHFERIGIGGYPEGHGSIETSRVESAIRDKAPYATHMVSQLCFDAAATTAWVRRLRASGVDLPVRIGLPGSVSRQKLIRISAGLGLGQSARFLKKQQNMLWRFFLPRGYRPDRLLNRLAPQAAAPDTAVSGFHLFTFNELKRTEAWRRARLDRLREAERS